MSAIQYSSLSKEELYLISRAEFENQKVITSDFTRRLFKSAKKAADILDTLTRKGRLFQIQRGKYLVVPIKAPNQQWMPNEFVTASLWMGDIPYYIGYFTMYNYWGFTDQVPQTIFIANTKRNAKKTIGNTQYEAMRIEENKYYGVQKINIENEEICISDKERTLVDFIYKPIGSFDNVQATLKNNIKKINVEKFVKYLKRFPVASVRKRAGYLLEKQGCSKNLLIQLQKSFGPGQSFVVLDPNNIRKGKVNKEWQIIVNR
jgi:predicted transcriptional regulator of viral defense system